MDSPKIIEYVYPGAAKQPMAYNPLILYAHAKFQYFEPRPEFSMFSILKNPMIMMMVFGMGMMLIMPKMMENMDDEQKAQMQRQMEVQKDPSKMLSQFWGEISGAVDDSSSATQKVKRDKNARRIKRE